jgi:hypothetical protein
MWGVNLTVCEHYFLASRQELKETELFNQPRVYCYQI